MCWQQRWEVNTERWLESKRRWTFRSCRRMEIRGSFIILFVTVLFPTTMTITFILAVSSEHVYPIMPFMSYTGDRPIESCFFSLGLNLVASLYIFILFLRYNQVIKFCERENPENVTVILRLNRNSVPWGIASSLGLSVTGSFQELHIAIIHRLGALICTYSGFIFLWYQTILSELTMEILGSKQAYFFRLVLSFLTTIIHVIAPVMVAILDLSYPRCHEDTLLWRHGEDGWHLHVSCSFLEWSIFFINVSYVASYYSEFKKIRIKSDEIEFEQREESRATGTREFHYQRKSK